MVASFEDFGWIALEEGGRILTLRRMRCEECSIVVEGLLHVFSEKAKCPVCTRMLRAERIWQRSSL